ncbi:MAG: hypothetical protein D4R67_06995 [Bacteroidetes bacterium]|nr:MAG: hypothetical protein D4R67_06995 [Bacteroidota bacterium]
MTLESGENWLNIYADNKAILEGYEKIKERDCARIRVTFTGVLLGKGSMQGIYTETTGKVSGTDVVWFDYKNGVLIKLLSKGSATSITQTSGAQKMTRPSTRDVVKEVELVD